MSRHVCSSSPCAPARPACPPPAPPTPCGGYLMQRVLARGQAHIHRKCYPLCLGALPDQTTPPVTVLEAAVRGCPAWEERPCCERGGMTLYVSVPLQLRVRDGRGCVYVLPASITEELRLHSLCPTQDLWQGQIFVQAAVRLAGRVPPCERAECSLPLDVMIDGYVLAPCTLNCASPAAFPDPRPWYPTFDPCRGGGYGPCRG